MMNKIEFKKYFTILIIIGCLSLSGCLSSGELVRPELPSLAYARQMHSERFNEESPSAPVGVRVFDDNDQAEPIAPLAKPAFSSDSRASLQFVKQLPPEEQGVMGDIVTNMPKDLNAPNHQPEAGYQVQRSSNPNVRPYHGPLHLGEPGASASLWRASGQGSQLYRDHRAFQPMDLITILIAEKSEGTKEADTDTKKDSTFLMGISKFFNFTDDIEAKNPGVTSSQLLDTNVQNAFTGEGETSRKGSLKASLSAVVVEVYPNGIMRIEGEKIISVNNEEQIIVLSGLVRPKDVNSNNEVMSDKIANIRIDYFGKGVIGEVQSAGWLGRVISSLWPF